MRLWFLMKNCLWCTADTWGCRGHFCPIRHCLEVHNFFTILIKMCALLHGFSISIRISVLRELNHTLRSAANICHLERHEHSRLTLLLQPFHWRGMECAIWAGNSAYMYGAWTSSNRVTTLCNLYCCFLP